MISSKYVTRFNKETAVKGHGGTILASNILPDGMKAPFGAAWGYLEGKSMMEEHAHPTQELYTVFRGKGYCTIDGERFPVLPGDVIDIPPNSTHTMECEDGEELLWAAYWWNV